MTSIGPIILHASDNVLRTLLEQLGTVVFSADGVTIRYHVPYSDFIG